jgi:hypothetical protein
MDFRFPRLSSKSVMFILSKNSSKTSTEASIF